MKKGCPQCRGAGHRRWFIQEKHKGNCIVKFTCTMCEGVGKVTVQEHSLKRIKRW